MKVWISVYALMQGIEEKDVEICSSISEDTVIENGIDCIRFYHGKGREWHLTKEDAIRKADELRNKKIDLLKRQIKKLQNMKFE